MLSVEEILLSHTQTLPYKKTLQMIKMAWLKQIQEKQGNTIYDIYFHNMTKVAIALLNQVDTKIYLNHHCHKGKDFEISIADNKVRDLCELYRYHYLSNEQLFVHLNALKQEELFYFLVRYIYPSFYYEEGCNLVQDYHNYHHQLSIVIPFLKERIPLPQIII